MIVPDFSVWFSIYVFLVKIVLKEYIKYCYTIVTIATIVTLARTHL